MKLLVQFAFLFVLFSFISCDSKPKKIEEQLVSRKTNNSNYENVPLFNLSGNTLVDRINPPESYVRKPDSASSFAEFLRNLALKPHDTKVRFFNGQEKANHSVYCAVVDLDIGKKDLHQCADAIMRLKAEHHWRKKEYDKIHFNFTNGFRVDYARWLEGGRMIVNGNTTYWEEGSPRSNSYTDFWSYLELVFMYAGTASLEKELLPIDNKEAEIGDVLIRGGHPGHAVLVVDKAVHHKSAKPLYLLAQSYMPAQEIQILINPMNSELNPWYDLSSEIIETPEWSFDKSEIKRFSD